MVPMTKKQLLISAISASLSAARRRIDSTLVQELHLETQSMKIAFQLSNSLLDNFIRLI